MVNNIYYVYAHYREDDGLPFYIGKGKDDRAYQYRGRNEYWHRVVKKHGRRVEILFKGLSEEEAFVREVEIGNAFMDFNPGTMTNNRQAFGHGGNLIDWTQDRRDKQSKWLSLNNPSRKRTPEEKRRISDLALKARGVKRFAPYFKSCPVCGEAFLINKPSDRSKKYCSNKCLSASFQGSDNPFYGKKHSETTKKKWANRQNGNKNTMAKGNKGYHTKMHKNLNIPWEECLDCKKLREKDNDIV